MRLRAVTLTNVRRFTGSVQVANIGDGLNLLSAPNEQGKSTLFDALRAVFTLPHGARSAEVRALQPHAGGGPEVTVEIELAQGRYTIQKRWLSKPTATVHQGDRLIAQADLAEAWLEDHLGKVGTGPSGLLWVRQGLTDLVDRDLKGQALKTEQAARQDLLSSVTGEVEAMTGGRRMDAARAAVDAALDEDLTAKGGVKKGGRLQRAMAEVDRLETLVADLGARTQALHQALDQRRQARRSLADIDAPEAQEARADRQAKAVEALRVARAHAATLETAVRDLELAQVAADHLQGQAQTRAAAAREATAARAESDAASASLGAARAAAKSADGVYAAAGAALDQARLAVAQADRAARRARAQQAARDGAARRAELAERLARAEAARARFERHKAVAAQGPDAAQLARLRDLQGAVVAARTVRDAGAVQVWVDYDDGVDHRITVDDAPLFPGEPRAVPKTAVFHLPGLGRLRVEPGDTGQGDGDPVARAQAELASALDRAGMASVEAAADAAARRETAIRDCDLARTEGEALAPQGLDALRAALAAVPQEESAPGSGGAEEAAPPVDLAMAETDLLTTQQAVSEAQLSRDRAAADRDTARSDLARATAQAEASAARLARAQAAIDADQGPQDDLPAKLQAAHARVTEARTARDTLRANAPDLAAAEAAQQRAAAVIAATTAERNSLAETLARLDGQIGVAAGDAVEQTLADTADQLQAARAHLDRVTADVAALRRLARALDAARADARERYFAPIAAELRPVMAMLWPDADLTWADDTLLPTALTRGGVPEDINSLSGGTREQIALMVRLAFARLLIRRGTPAPLILDDALVFTDDDRIEQMFNALHAQAQDLQILVFSCRQRVFRDLGGTRLTLASLGPTDP